MGYYIGLQVYQSQHTGLAFLHQHMYIQHTLQRFSMADAYTVWDHANTKVSVLTDFGD